MSRKPKCPEPFGIKGLKSRGFVLFMTLRLGSDSSSP